MNSQQQLGGLQILAGLALLFFLPPVALLLIASGTMALIAGTLFKPATLEANSDRDSPTYGFNQFQNPVKGDSALAVIYSNDTAARQPGHKAAPVYLQAFTTPAGFESGDDDPKAISSQGQGLSCLLAVGEGPVLDVYDIRANDEPLYDEAIGKAVNENCNGTRTTFTVSGKRFDLPTVKVYVAASATATPVLKGWVTLERTELMATADGTKTLFVKDLTNDEYDTEAPLTFRLDSSSGTAVVATGTTDTRFHAWFETYGTTGSSKRLVMNTQTPLAAGRRVYVTLTQRYLNGFTMKEKQAGDLEIAFATAPANGSKITVDYRRRRMPNLRVDIRKGGDSQSPLDDFAAIRNTVGVNSELVQSVPQTFTTNEPVDDVTVDLASGDGGFTQYDATTGDRSVVSATFRIEFSNANDDGTTTGQTTYVLKDPGGPRGNYKSALEFEMRGDTIARKYYSISIRFILKRLAETNPNDTLMAAALTAFSSRSKKFVRVTRTNQCRANSSTLVQDRIVLLSYRKILDERLLYPGTALLGIHALASDRLQGSAPRITCRVRGKRDVEYWSGSAWVASETAQANPVWAAIDLITHLRYGGGAQFTKADNIDTTTALTAASWCDDTLTLQGNATEKRAVLDYVLDTRMSLMEHVRNMLLPAQVVPVLVGNVWSFVVDRDVTLSSVPVVYDDSTDGRTAKNSMKMTHHAVTSLVTEMQVSYFDRDDDFERNEVWRAPQTPATNRRIKRATCYGVTRVTQATRYAEFIYQRARQQGVNVSWAMTPGGLRLQAGDVVRVVSTRIGIDFYARVMKWELVSTDGEGAYVVRVDAAQYVPAVYGQHEEKQTVIRRSASSGQSAGVNGGTVGADGEMVATPCLAAAVERVE